MDSPQIRVKLSSAEVEGSPRVDLDFGVKEENVSERERGAIFRTSLGEARHVRPSDPLSLSISTHAISCAQVFRFQQEGIWTTSPGKVASPRSEGCESPMKQALHAAEAFERGQTPPLSPEDKRASKPR